MDFFLGRSLFFFFNDTATTEIYTLSLHDALPIFRPAQPHRVQLPAVVDRAGPVGRSEEHTSELQSRGHLVCRLLLEKKKHPTTGRQCTYDTTTTGLCNPPLSFLLKLNRSQAEKYPDSRDNRSHDKFFF